jgi:glycosyltransferase involved in cell wall biosynthesis
MTHLIQKFDRFLLLPVNDAKEALSVWPSGAHDVREITGITPSATRDCSTSQFCCASLQNWSFTIKNFSSFLKKLTSNYLLLIEAEKKISCDELSLRRLLKALEKKRVGIVYSDFIWQEGNHLNKCPLIDYQQGSIRDDFNFGHLVIFTAAAVKSALQKYGSLPSDADEALYDLRLKVSVDYELIHVPEFLYTVTTEKQKKIKNTGRKTENHFAYVAKGNLLCQKKLEKIATNHLKRIGAYLPPRTKSVNKEQNDLQWKASVVIPVLNRKKTIADALESALGQKTDFPFNIIVVDNYSTDGTTDILRKFALRHSHVHHLIPSRRDLGIGGCWNEAIYSPYCGRYVIQLDSDDRYSSPRTLQKIVNTLRRGRYAMVVGSYTIVDERLKKIPPGLIAHKEWTQANGHNNLLRVNGMGAPRAFDLSVIRRIGFPNVSYGEDYAAALKITREYKVGRIYENLYWCRRWKDNTDAGLPVAKQNLNNFYKDKLRTAEIEARKPANRKASSFGEERIFAEFSGGKDLSLTSLCQSLYDSQKKTWPGLADACHDLASAQTRKLSGENYKIILQYNPARAVSSGASVDKESIKKRPCFLCDNNLPSEQLGVLYRNQYLILCNPAPIFEKHFTVVSLRHESQTIALSIGWLLRLSADLPGSSVFYNGPACGASAPDHLHFQAVPKKSLPFLRELKQLSPVYEKSSVCCSRGERFDRSIVVLESKNADELTEQFLNLMQVTQKSLKTNDEPMVNVICNYSGRSWRLVVFLRQKHRPDAYFAENEKRIFVSPGAVDMSGVVITPLLDNYSRLDYHALREIYREVSLPDSVMDLIVNDL